MIRAVLTAFVVAVAACSATDPCAGVSGTCVALFVDEAPSAIAALRLEVTIEDPAAQFSREVRRPDAATFSAPAAVALQLGDSATRAEGATRLTIDALGIGDATAAAGSVVTMVERGQRAEAHLALRAVDSDGSSDVTDLVGSSDDLDVPSDGGTADLTPAGPRCGDGVVEGSEQCDDGNQSPNDGCDPSCMRTPGWICPNPGMRCKAAQCGDGIIAGAEQCEDGGNLSGDGCDSKCRLEPGYICPSIGQACSPTICGDGVQRGLESCDDANNESFDGCTLCRIDPPCPGGRCTPLCGDGIKLPTEECDDGNAVPNDGCSAGCTFEPGFTCSLVSSLPSLIGVTVMYRDFLKTGTTTTSPPGTGHPDFGGSFNGAATGLVQANLGSDGKPVFASNKGSASSSVLTDATSFSTWFHANATYNRAITSGIVLQNVMAGFPIYRYDGNPFFPIEGQGFPQTQADCSANQRNFYFTTEMHIPVIYDAAATAPSVQVNGKDDIWVFAAGKLVMDLGGIHSAMAGSFTLDAAKAAQLGVSNGDVISIDIFHANRSTCDSRFTLTLSNIVTPQTRCEPL